MSYGEVAVCVVGSTLMGFSVARYLYSSGQVAKPYDRYGSNLHRLEHYLNKSGGGQIAHVPVHVIDSREHTRVHGLVCAKCGYVSVNRELGQGEGTEEKIFEQSALRFCWTLESELQGARQRKLARDAEVPKFYPRNVEINQ